MLRPTSLFTAGVLALASLLAAPITPAAGQEDPVVQKIIELGTTDNQVMKWADYATNRFGGRITGSDAYLNAAEWALWQFEEWGLEAYFDEVGEVDVGFNRGPWFGKMVVPEEKALYFGTPSFTAGTQGVQRGPVVILEADPFSIPGRRPSPEDVEAKRLAVEEAIAEVQADPAKFDGAWVLIAGESSGFGRDGRRNTPEYSDSQLMPPLTQTLKEAGALGTIQSGSLPLKILDGHVVSWDHLPELPDIKLVDTQYNEIKAMVEGGTSVELEFDVRNWFKMGPVPYHNIVGVIPGTTYPDEYVILGGHFDSFDGGTGGVDDGSGFSPGMEAVRLIKAAGGAPKRSIAMVLFAAEEIGLVGSQDFLADHPDMHDKIVTMINRDGSPSAITGAVVPPAWEEDLREISAPLADLNPTWPFELSVNHYPSLKPVNPGGTDASSFSMMGIPTFRFRTETDYSYGRAWHTLYDTYSELVPYTDHQRHSALATAVVAYGIANLDEPLPREGNYLPDGLFADITTTSGARVIASLDYENAPLQAAYFIRLAEGSGAQAGGGGRGRMGPPLGQVEEVAEGMINAVIDAESRWPLVERDLPLTPNPSVKHDRRGVLGLSGANTFYITMGENAELDSRFTALGHVVAGAHTLGDFSVGDRIRSIRILRSGKAARAFATDEATFRRLLRDR
ncbi:MAG: M20/M25/M40 family metallo-hydrolase [Gemmatimonadetes bacterium]|nr:M20/M25/M40 family metallo-hydrolase [Gemmatimonadota bacterium]